MTILEICKVSDKQVSYFLEVNKSLGWDIIKFNNTYYTYLKTDYVYKSATANFATIQDGLYVFKE